MVFFSEEKKALIECLLFVSFEPLTIDKIAEVVELDGNDVLMLIKELQDDYQKPERGLELIEVANGYRLVTKSQYAFNIEKLYKPHAASLSKAALETLAIVAYKQPITRAEIEFIRGVKIDGVLTNLLERNLVTEVGRKEGPGRPILYGTTSDFLAYFGLKSLNNLPSLD